MFVRRKRGSTDPLVNVMHPTLESLQSVPFCQAPDHRTQKGDVIMIDSASLPSGKPPFPLGYAGSKTRRNNQSADCRRRGHLCGRPSSSRVLLYDLRPAEDALSEGSVLRAFDESRAFVRFFQTIKPRHSGRLRSSAMPPKRRFRCFDSGRFPLRRRTPER